MVIKFGDPIVIEEIEIISDSNGDISAIDRWPYFLDNDDIPSS